MATTPAFLPGRIPWTEEPGKLQPIRCKELDKIEATQHSHMQALLSIWPWVSEQLTCCKGPQGVESCFPSKQADIFKNQYIIGTPTKLYLNQIHIDQMLSENLLSIMAQEHIFKFGAELHDRRIGKFCKCSSIPILCFKSKEGENKTPQAFLLLSQH